MPRSIDLRTVFAGLTESLANLSINWVLIGIGALLVALAVLRAFNRSPRSQAAWVAENIQVVLSVVVVVFLIIRPFLFQAFYIPSNSMVPTLMGPPDDEGYVPPGGSGDRLLVNKLIYRLGAPHRYDIAVFHAPVSVAPDGKEYIKRVIGLPGETVEVIAPRLLVDGKPAINVGSESGFSPIAFGEAEASAVQVQGNVARLRSNAEEFKIVASPNAATQYTPYGVRVDGKLELEDSQGPIQTSAGLESYGAIDGFPGTVYLVQGVPRLAVVKGRELKFDDGHVLVDGKRLIEKYVKEEPHYSMAPRKLEKTQYFMMGDNRNNSNDSHAWGPLEGDRLIGRAEILFWPVNRFRIFHGWLLSLLVGIFLSYQLALRFMSR